MFAPYRRRGDTVAASPISLTLNTATLGANSPPLGSLRAATAAMYSLALRAYAAVFLMASARRIDNSCEIVDRSRQYIVVIEAVFCGFIGDEMSALPMLAQATEVASEPNWVLIGSIVGAFVILAIVLMFASKKRLGADKTPDKAIEDASGSKDSGAKALEDKEQLSLAEIKVAKREAVSADKSKEELRELRKERRAASQTDKAIHEREEAEEKAKETAESSTEEKDDDKKVEEKSETEEKVQEEAVASESDAKADEATDKGEEKAEEKKSDDPLGDLFGQSSSDTGDVFASLFGSKNSSLDIFGSSDFDVDSAPKASNATVFPTLGSALIPLDDLKKSAENSDSNPLDELTKRLNEKAEKKTPSYAKTNLARPKSQNPLVLPLWTMPNLKTTPKRNPTPTRRTQKPTSKKPSRPNRTIKKPSK